MTQEWVLMVCLGIMMITTLDYSYAALCHALVGLSYGLCFRLTLCHRRIRLAFMIGRLRLLLDRAD